MPGIPPIHRGPALFRPPTRKVPLGTGGLAAHISLYRGVTVLVTGGVAREAQYPTQDEVNAADAAYIGGHEYIVTGDELLALYGAGYTDYLTPADVYTERCDELYGGGDL